MKGRFLFLFLLAAVLCGAQQPYQRENDLPYYPDSLSRKDTYIAGRCRLDLYYPKGVKNFATIVWFHGGGLTGGQKEIPEALTARGYAVVGVNYRLSPTAKAPAYIEDAAAAVAWVFANIGRYGGDTGLIVVSGHSAGGYLAMMVALDKQYLAKWGVDADRLAAVVPFSGQAITHFTIRKERGMADTQPLVDRYAPLYYVRAGAPPLLLITGDREQELLGRYEENAYLWRMMQLAGHGRTRLYELDGFDHGGMAEPAFPLLLRETAAAVKERRSREVPGGK